MLALGPLAFAVPWMLGLLVALPVIYWLLRLMPPAPQLVQFPAIRLLLGLEPEEKTPHRIPWWLLLLRLLLAALLIVAFARPLLNPQADLPGGGPLALVIDDGWAAAPTWGARMGHAERLVQRAERAGRTVYVVLTAPPALDDAQPPRGQLRPDDARKLLRALKPKPWPTERAAAVAEIERQGVREGSHVVWLADGVETPDARALADRLARIGAVEVVLPDAARAPLLLLPPAGGGRDLLLKAQRPAGDGPRRIAVQGLDDKGKLVARATLDFGPTATEAEASIEAPVELRNRLQRFDVEGQSGAGATVLLDERHRRRPVGILGEIATVANQPLLQEVYYLERALEPYAALTVGDRATVLARATSVLLVPDGAAPSADDRAAIEDWMRKGGVVVRFAGPRLAAGDDALTPVKLRLGDRSLGGVMSWGEPAKLAEFPPGSPFHGLPVPDDVTVTQQVLAEPAPDLADKLWARLGDGTPLVTADRRGQGWLVLIHTSANTSWSNLSLSGLFVEMLQRMVALSRGVAGADAGAQALKPWMTLDGFARLVSPPPGAQALPVDAAQTFVPKPTTPPGLYGDESAQVAFNVGGRIPAPRALSSLPSGASVDRLSEEGEVDLSRWLIAAALALLLLDIALSLWLRGLLPRAVRLPRAAAAAVALAVAASAFVLLAPAPDALASDALAQAQQRPGQPPPRTAPAPAAPGTPDEAILRATVETRLAYVIVGDAEIDEVSRAGLEGLGEILRARTSVEPAEPIGVDLEKDELRLYPFLYWPVSPAQATPSKAAQAAVDRYLKSGGVILFDTRDQHLNFGRTAANPDLRRLLQGVEIPPLQPLPPEHVLTKSFYLMSDFPGRWAGGRLWLEAGAGRVNDGVATVIIGSNDYAAAWAIDGNGRTMIPVSGGETQREMAYRFGVNLVMYALTGNYKDDQVHFGDILKRLQR